MQACQRTAPSHGTLCPPAVAKSALGGVPLLLPAVCASASQGKPAPGLQRIGISALPFECQHWTQAEQYNTLLSRQGLRHSCRTSSCLCSAADVSAPRCRYDGDACAQCADGYQLVNGICQRTLDSFMAQALAQSSQSSTGGKVSRAGAVQEGKGSCCVPAEPAVWAAALEHSLMLHPGHARAWQLPGKHCNSSR